jgi:hypothetical protein
MSIMKKLSLVVSASLLAIALGGCTVIQTAYTPPAYIGAYVAPVNYYGLNAYWGPDYTGGWYGSGVYYGPSIYSYDW